MEAQITDFENAAFTAFVVLLSRVILALDLNLYIPISKMEENMAIAHKRNAAVDEKFWFPLPLARGVEGRISTVCASPWRFAYFHPLRGSPWT